MPTSQILELAFGLALGLTGLALIRRAWFNRHGHHLGAMSSGWGLVLLAAFPLAHALGGDLGVTSAFIAPMLLAMAIMTLGLFAPAPLPDGQAKASTPQVRSNSMASVRTLAVIGLAGPGALIVSTLASMALFQSVTLLGWQTSDALFTGLLFSPLSWAALSVIAALDAPLRWRAGVLLALAVVFAALSALLMTLSA